MSDRQDTQTGTPLEKNVHLFHRLFPWIARLVSVSAALLIVVHMVWPSIAIDSTTVALLVVVILP